ncbi:Metalloendoproteinase 4-MMP [Ananas comosus]|uniref:Metalloendoproteinase 4-MMP n=1 Tax=Ananas comosus TaxID=4615 RepID=A0A199UM22_ANACO|nr:Metalloendoproteinase 4-MMP [Ananas comosus]
MLPLIPTVLVLLLCPSLLARPAPDGASPIDTWRSSERLLGAGRGSHVAGVGDLKRYLARFGYLPGSAASDRTDSFDARFESAVSLYQTRLGLPVSGKLDAATLAEIAAPRCGVPDRPAARADSVRRFAFFPGSPRWARPGPLVLTYAISPAATIDYVPRAAVAAAFRRAFARWARVIPVRFAEARDYGAADVKVGFYAGEHGDGEPFDGVLGVLAHAFSPESGRLHLDAAERWAVDFDAERSAVAVDLESVATHEIGHVLGLAHSPVRGAVMYPSLRPRTRKAELGADDVRGVQALYGSNPDFSFSSLSASSSDTSASASVAAAWSSTSTRVGIVLVAAATVIFPFI